MARSGGGDAGSPARTCARLGEILCADGADVSGDAPRSSCATARGEEIGRVIAEHQLVISELAPVGSSLEEVYFELTGSEAGGPS